MTTTIPSQIAIYQLFGANDSLDASTSFVARFTESASKNSGRLPFL